ncbi:putative toxin [bacterium]|nr:putative toxin [bacterium]
MLAAYRIGDKAKCFVNGRWRIPDGVSKTAISEVKNVRYQRFTRQLKEYIDIANDLGREFHLYVRPDTVLSTPLQKAITDNVVKKFNILGL